MKQPSKYNFKRFLEAKRSVDDRALNRQVRDALADALSLTGPETELDVLEIGAGTGIMLERLLEWELLCKARYTALDLSADHLAEARRRLPVWASEHDYRCDQSGDGCLQISNASHNIILRLVDAEVGEFIRHERECGWDLLIAHAFLDLIDIPATLPKLVSLLRPGGLFYLTINFDGETILEPEIDQALDTHIMDLYHRTMDERVVNGRTSGDSRSGRHLFGYLTTAGATVMAAGASDWVVYPLQNRYPHDEGYFLHYIIDTIRGALDGHPEIDGLGFEKWIARRHMQIERGELVYIAHQLDFAVCV